MKKCIDYINLLRVKHYVKNFLIFLPILFGGQFFIKDQLIRAVEGFLCFCLLSSAVYIINDLKDMENDQKHPTKKERPLASKRIKTNIAIIILAICLTMTMVLSIIVGIFSGGVCLAIYFMLNAAYSLELKNKPIIDIVILSSGFVIRVIYGGLITGIEISQWLYLVIVAGSFFMSLGKRRNELKLQNEANIETREVLRHYTEEFLDKNMYVCMALADAFYALWTMELSNKRLMWTAPVFFIILMRYSFDIEKGLDGDPVEVIFKDEILIWLCIAYMTCVFVILYLPLK